MTSDELIAATGCSVGRAEVFAAPLTDAMAEYDIDTTPRQAAFLAQIAHESGKFLYLRELWGPTPAQLRYEGRVDLGNTQAGDGFKYRGRGLIQITGRANYAEMADWLSLPLLDVPGMLEQPQYAAESAACWWAKHGCNEIADTGDFEALTRRINGGLMGESDRLALFQQATQALA